MTEFADSDLDDFLDAEAEIQTVEHNLVTLDAYDRTKIGVEIAALEIGITPEELVKRRAEAAGLNFVSGRNTIRDYRASRSRFVGWLLNKVVPVQ